MQTPPGGCPSHAAPCPGLLFSPSSAHGYDLGNHPVRLHIPGWSMTALREGRLQAGSMPDTHPSWPAEATSPCTLEWTGRVPYFSPYKPCPASGLLPTSLHKTPALTTSCLCSGSWRRQLSSPYDLLGRPYRVPMSWEPHRVWPEMSQLTSSPRGDPRGGWMRKTCLV